MSPKHKDAPEENPEPRASQRLTDLVGRHVLDQLGRPTNLQRVQVRQLWTDHYRVNVFVGADATSVSLAESYFVVADDAGGIVKSVPPIKRVY